MEPYRLFILLIAFLVSCSNPTSSYEQTVLDYLKAEQNAEIYPKVYISRIYPLPDITVADSIIILEEKYRSEKSKKIKIALENISRLENDINKKNRSLNYLITQVSISRLQEQLVEERDKLISAEQWRPDYLNRYDAKSPSEILAKRIKIQFSFQNPKLDFRQELTADFILSPDGDTCYKMEIDLRESFPYQVPLEMIIE